VNNTFEVGEDAAQMRVPDGLYAANYVQRVEDRTQGRLATLQRAEAGYTKILKENTELASLDLRLLFPENMFNKK
jgi:hypothetical protein